MDLSFTPQHQKFRADVNAFIATAIPPDIRAKAEVDAGFDMPEIMRWHKILYQRGWVAPHWPEAHGGPGLDPTSRFILSEELEMAGAPSLSPFGITMVGPLLIEFGSDEQKKRFLPPILSGEEVWCQGYSEPNAGSDLASLRTRADIVDGGEGDGDFVVTGQKTWTTYAQYADWIFCLVRTDSSGKKQDGISFLLIDMKSPGIEVKPMLTLGGTEAFCETFFDSVRVPRANLVGPLHGGWTLAKALLGHERTAIAAVGMSQRMLRRVKRIAGYTVHRGVPLIENAEFRARIARAEIRLRALQMANYRTVAGAQLGRAPGPESSILKIRGTELHQEISELTMDVIGHNSLSWFNDGDVVPAIEAWVPQSFNYLRAATVYGGSNEIQRNVIAKNILGLPMR
ncbi:MAG: acyl-CoA dehydrogenase family protein [Proteobacteria bacterium]|nr:acyl-CoA dehydrogenase family protein [Pseudomonadota bacterium]